LRRFDSELAVATTRAPKCFATWIVAEPTPPAPACTSTVDSAPMRTWRVNGIHAVRKVSRNDAPSSNDAPSGKSTSSDSSTATHSAYPPPAARGSAITRRPSTSPATSEPRIVGKAGACG
jgi:hypothetical protein